MNHIDFYELQALSPWNPKHALGPADFLDPKPVLAKFLSFSNKEEYLSWRDEWRRAYADLSQTIRELRATWRAQGSDHLTSTHHALFGSRALARSMLALRKASKIRAEQQYQANKQQTAEVA
jgi:hypothetical protein